MTATVTPALTSEILCRISYRPSPDGAFAACLAVLADGRTVAEAWSLNAPGPTARTLPGSVVESARTQVVPTPDGRVLALRLGVADHSLVLLEARDDDARDDDARDDDTRDTETGRVADSAVERPVATLTTRGARLIPSPDPRVLGLLVTTGEATEIWHVLDGPEPSLHRVLTSSDLLGGGVWLSTDGSLLSLAQMTGDGPAPVVADLRTGTVTPDPAAPPAGLVTAAHPASGLRLLMVADPARPLRLAGPAGPRTTTPTALNTVTGSVRALEFSPDGARLAVHSTDGARSRLFDHDLDADTVREIEIPDGTIGGPLHWSDAGVRFLFSCPAHPAGLATLGPDGTWTVAGARRRTREVHLEQVAGATGPVEAVVYGGADWWKAPDLVLALHGGPAENWRLDFDYFFSALDDAGIAVLALNQRGSTGYGRAYQDSLRGAWGVPDLDDVLSVGEDLAARRRALGLQPPVLYGVSYGGFLAMLALHMRPQLWLRCAVGAPFLSADRLHADATAQVRAMLDSLGARPVARDAHGPRDLAALYGPGAEITHRPAVYLVHGRQDTTIPVQHSRDLARLLGDAGWREGDDLHYRELPDTGHGIFASEAGEQMAASLVRFIRHGSPRPRPAAETAHELRGPLAAVR